MGLFLRWDDCDIFLRFAVSMGKPLDGVSPHMDAYDARTPLFSAKHKRAEILLNYLPVGLEAAACFYAACGIDAGMEFIEPNWAPPLPSDFG